MAQYLWTRAQNSHMMLYLLCFIKFVLHASCINVLYACCIFVFYEIFLAQVLWNFVLYISACGTRSGDVEIFVIYFPPVLCLFCMYVVKKKQKQKNKKWCVVYFLRVKHALVFCVIFFGVWNALWYVVLYFSARRTRSGISCYIFPAYGTRSGILYYIFSCVERALSFFVIYLCVWNALWYFVLYFQRVECTLVFCVIFLIVWNALWNFVLHFSACGTRSGIFDLCALVLWNFVLYFSACGFHSGIVVFLLCFPRV